MSPRKVSHTGPCMVFLVKCVLCPECGVCVVVSETTTIRDDSQPESVAPNYLVAICAPHGFAFGIKFYPFPARQRDPSEL
jgi:hypothetical protein